MLNNGIFCEEPPAWLYARQALNTKVKGPVLTWVQQELAWHCPKNKFSTP